MDTSSQVAAILSLAGVIITGLLTTLTAIRSGKDRRERNADRRKIEEETTDVILKRVRAELDRAYQTIDIKDRQLRMCARFIDENRSKFAQLGIRVPDIHPDEGPTLTDDIVRLRHELDQDLIDDTEDDRLTRDDKRIERDPP